jgi:probable HAF family extracellular repeat protein
MLKRNCLLALALLPAIFAPLYSHAAPLYTVGLFVDNFTVSDMNNSGQMAGAGGTGHAAFYANGVVTDIGAGGNFGRVQAINDAGDMTGTVNYDGGYIGDFHGFVYRNRVLTNLGPRSIGASINANGDVVGSVSTSASVDRTSGLYRGGQWTQLGNIDVGDDGGAVDINDQGQIVGFAKVTDVFYAYNPYLYSDGMLHDLGSVTGFSVNGASAINNAGRIAGYGEGWDGRHAFVYENGHMTDLGTFGGLELDVGGMNESGTFVGSASREDETRLGFIYLNGMLVDLNTVIDPALGWRIDGAAAINDSGQIAAHACRGYTCGTIRLDLASAVPEPAGALLIVPGLLLLARRHGKQLQRNKRATAASRIAAA